MWDPDMVLNSTKKIGNNSNLTLKDLTLIIVVLVALTSQQRVQRIVSLSKHECMQDKEWCQFAVISHLKQ